jgi:hypothetical protein
VNEDESEFACVHTEEDFPIAEETHNTFQKGLTAKESTGKKHVGFNDDVEIILFEDVVVPTRARRASFTNEAEVKTFEVFTEMIPTQALFDDVEIDDFPAADDVANYPSREKNIHFDIDVDACLFELDADKVPIGDFCSDARKRSCDVTHEASPSSHKTIIQDLTYLLAELVDPNYFQQADKIFDLNTKSGRELVFQ